jgi:hypothetical protein
MSTTNEAIHTASSLCAGCRGPLSPVDTMLCATDLQHRYGGGRDKTYELISSPGFVHSILPGTIWVASLEALQRWELAHQLAGTLAALPSALPTPPQPGRPGPKGSGQQ